MVSDRGGASPTGKSRARGNHFVVKDLNLDLDLDTTDLIYQISKIPDI